MDSIYIIILIVGFIAYRMLRFNKLNKGVKIISHNEDRIKVDYDGSFEINTSKIGYVKEGEKLYSFFLTYKNSTIIGQYVATELLENFVLESAVLEYEVINGLNPKYDVEFKIRTQLFPPKEVTFYFNIGTNNYPMG